jgi:hypothetical protein
MSDDFEEPKPELRFIRRMPAGSIREGCILQQLWHIWTDDGTYAEWRDVPLVEEES